MKRILLSLFFVLVFSNFVLGQETSNLEKEEKTNPIIFFEGFGGPSVVKNLGVSGGVGLNYQLGESLFTFRYINSAGYRRKNDGAVIIAPSVYKSEDNVELALMYGRRWVKEHHSYSISAGISRNNLELESRDLDGIRTVSTIGFYGFPFEANYKRFYSKKRSNLIYNVLIPSVGFKLFGDIGKYTFVGVGVSVGFGLCKHY
ncbi:hypothetical protein ACQ9BO_26725 [Flavobacterium sp. P21]|uniref:hypothetical protein n=1 Tax=Flavobacterium sp. P21 TaxID=3423948 RepID=UPI003D667F39